MTLRIFKESGRKVERINHVMKVLTHSQETAIEGIDIDVYFFNPDMSFEMKKIHIDKWDFYDVEA